MVEFRLPPGEHTLVEVQADGVLGLELRVEDTETNKQAVRLVRERQTPSSRRNPPLHVAVSAKGLLDVTHPSILGSQLNHRSMS